MGQLALNPNDGRRLRTQVTEKRIRLAIDRLRREYGRDNTNCPSRSITLAALALEASVHISTLYRMPSTMLLFRKLTGPVHNVKRNNVHSHRQNTLYILLKRQLKLAIQEQLRLSRALEKLDPTLGIEPVVQMDEASRLRKAKRV